MISDADVPQDPQPSGTVQGTRSGASASDPGRVQAHEAEDGGEKARKQPKAVRSRGFRKGGKGKTPTSVKNLIRLKATQLLHEAKKNKNRLTYHAHAYADPLENQGTLSS